MNTISVILRYGLTNRIEVDVPPGTTIRQLLQNASYRSVLKLPENVSAVIDGMTVSLDDTVSEGDTVVFEKQAASKA